MGVVAIALTFAGLIALPFMSGVNVGSGKFRMLSEFMFWTFLADVLLLTWLGACEITPTTVFAGQACTAFLYLHLFVFLPFLGWFENLFFTHGSKLLNTKANTVMA